MKRSLVYLAVIAAVLSAGLADAAAPPAKKLYRWVDKDGKVQFSDALPPEAVDQARSEMNASGRVTAELDRALTAEERVAFEAAEREAAAAREAAEKARDSEQAMLGSFQTEDDLRHSFKIRQELLKQTLDAIEASIEGQRDSLASLLQQATEAELADRPVHVRHARTIRELHREIGKQQQMLIVKQAELVDLDGEVERLLVRFRELKGQPAAVPGDEAAAPAAGDTTPAAPDAPADADAAPTG